MRNLYAAATSIVLLSLIGMQAACSRRPSNDAITKDIQSKVAADPDTKDSQVNVAAQNGKVTLTGSVASQAAQQRVAQIAHAEPGVTAVDDDQTAVQPAAAQAPAAAGAQPVEQPMPKPPPIIVPSGTVLAVRTTGALSSKTSQAGQTFRGTLARSVKVGGTTALPAGSTISGTVVTAKEKGRIKGRGELTLAGGALTGNQQIEVPPESVLNFTLSAPLTVPLPSQ